MYDYNGMHWISATACCEKKTIDTTLGLCAITTRLNVVEDKLRLDADPSTYKDMSVRLSVCLLKHGWTLTRFGYSRMICSDRLSFRPTTPSPIKRLAIYIRCCHGCFRFSPHQWFSPDRPTKYPISVSSYYKYTTVERSRLCVHCPSNAYTVL